MCYQKRSELLNLVSKKMKVLHPQTAESNLVFAVIMKAIDDLSMPVDGGRLKRHFEADFQLMSELKEGTQYTAEELEEKSFSRVEPYATALLFLFGDDCEELCDKIGIERDYLISVTEKVLAHGGMKIIPDDIRKTYRGVVDLSLIDKKTANHSD